MFGVRELLGVRQNPNLARCCHLLELQENTAQTRVQARNHLRKLLLRSAYQLLNTIYPNLTEVEVDVDDELYYNANISKHLVK